MKPTPAKEAARRAAEAKSKVAARVAEEAEARLEAAKLQKSRAASEKKLSCALMMAAAEGASSVVWKDDLSVLPMLGQRGLWVYECGSFPEMDVADRLREWRLQSLNMVKLKWIAHPDSMVRLTDREAMSRLFGGVEEFAALHAPAWETFFDKIAESDDLWLLRALGADRREYEGLLISSFQRAWLQAVRRGEIDPEMSFQSFGDYCEIYGDDLRREFRLEAHRTAKSLKGLLAIDECFASQVTSEIAVNFDGLDELQFDYVNNAIGRPAGAWPPLFLVDGIAGSEDEREMVGGILHPSICRYFNSSLMRNENFSALSGVEFLEIFWMPAQRDWLPFDDEVDENLLNWFGARDGKRFCSYVFGCVERAAEEGQTQVELVLTQLSASWTLSGDDELGYYSLSPTLLSLLLRGYGYKVKANSAGNKHRLFVTW